MLNPNKNFIISSVKSENRILYNSTFYVSSISKLLILQKESSDLCLRITFRKHLSKLFIFQSENPTLNWLYVESWLKQANEGSQLKINQFGNRKKNGGKVCRVSTCGRTFINLIRHITLVIFLITREKKHNFDGNCFSGREEWEQRKSAKNRESE